jgi:hypothetical protein
VGVWGIDPSEGSSPPLSQNKNQNNFNKLSPI